MTCSVANCANEARSKGLCYMHYMRQRRGKPLNYDSRKKPFWDKVKVGAPSECWPWVGFRKSNGHGLTTHKGIPIHASRKAWILTHGRIRNGLQVNHRCDNHVCCNPDHMYLGTGADNMIDYWAKTPADERAPRGRRTVLDAKQLEELWEMRRREKSLHECAEHFGVHISTVCRYITIVRKQKLMRMRGRVVHSHNP